MDLREISTKDHPESVPYFTVVISFIQGALRLAEAKAGYFRLATALFSFRSSNSAGLDGPGGETLSHLARIDFESFDSHRYVTDLSHLIYATSLLDTFLSETTLFLFLLHPLSMGKNQQVPLRMVIDANSRNEALTGAARARTREISYLPFLGRLQFLRETFGLHIVISPEAEAALEHYSSVRNAAVHDQGIFELLLDEGGQITARQKTCPRHPSKVCADDVDKATTSYKQVVNSVTKAVCSQVLKKDVYPTVPP